MKYNVGDKVRIKDIDWYNENKGKYGVIDWGAFTMWFHSGMVQYCGEILTIEKVVIGEFSYYIVKENLYRWTDEMIECKVEE